MAIDASSALPGWADCKTYYRRRWKYFNGAMRKLFGEQMRQHAARFILSGLFVLAIVAGLLTAGWEPLVWPLALIVATFAATVLWTWLTSPWAVLRDEVAEVARLEKLVARQHKSKDAGDSLRTLFFDGTNLLEQVLYLDAEPLEVLEWVDQYKEWRGKVLAVLKETSREEEFMFISAAFQHDVVVFAEQGAVDARYTATMQALQGKLEKLRRITGRSYKASEEGPSDGAPLLNQAS